MVLAFLILLISPITHAQSFNPCRFVEEGKEWYFEVSNPNGNPDYYAQWVVVYQLLGDTIIGNNECIKLYATSNCPFQMYENRYVGALFEVDSKVFHIIPENDTPSLLYDFSCQPGDNVKVYNTDLMIREKRAINIFEASVILITWSPTEFGLYKSYWIEGIGNYENDLINYPGSWNPGSHNYKLLSCNVKEKEVFNHETFSRTVSINKIFGSCSNANNWYNLLGFPLRTKPSNKGIYIKNGRRKVKI